MTSSQNKQVPTQSRTKSVVSWLLCLLVIGVAVGCAYWIQSTEPSAERLGAVKKTAMAVKTITVKRGNYRPILEATGTVRAAQEVSLRPRISGRVVKISDSLTPGSFVKKDEMLLQIDPEDYEQRLKQQEAQLRQAQSELEIEKGRKEAAEWDYEYLSKNKSRLNEDLLLRKPQLKSARAGVTSARAQIKEAELALERTILKAPFDAHVIQRDATIGSEITPGTEVARLVGTNAYWVETTLPQRALKYVAIPTPDEENERGSKATLRNRAAWPEESRRTGKVIRKIGALEPNTRLVKLLIEVNDPLSLEPNNDEKPALMLDAYHHVEIKGKPIKNIVRVPRDFLRKNNTIWVYQNGKLSIRDVAIRFKDAQYAYISEGLKDGDRVITTSLSTVKDGAPLQHLSDKNE